MSTTSFLNLTTYASGDNPTFLAYRLALNNTTNSNMTLIDTWAQSVDTALSNLSGVTTSALNLKAPLASPAFTGVPTAPTAAQGTNTTQLATTAFVQSAISIAGGGDMMKTTYDTTNNGIVDRAETADILTTTRTINGVNFNGSANITIYDSTKEPIISKATAFNQAFETTTSNIKMNGSVSVGALSTIARADHVHPVDTSRAAASHTHSVVTTSVDGLMLATDKVIVNTLNNVRTTTIPTTGWSAGPTYTITISDANTVGITSAHTPVINPLYNANNATALLEQTAWGCIDKIETTSGGIICYCYTSKPATAINIQIKGA